MLGGGNQGQRVMGVNAGGIDSYGVQVCFGTVYQGSGPMPAQAGIQLGQRIVQDRNGLVEVTEPPIVSPS